MRYNDFICVECNTERRIPTKTSRKWAFCTECEEVTTFEQPTVTA